MLSLESGRDNIGFCGFNVENDSMFLPLLAQGIKKLLFVSEFISFWFNYDYMSFKISVFWFLEVFLWLFPSTISKASYSENRLSRKCFLFFGKFDLDIILGELCLLLGAFDESWSLRMVLTLKTVYYWLSSNLGCIILFEVAF